MKCDERGTGWYGDTNISWQRIWSRMVAKSRTRVDVIPVAKLAWWTRFGESFEIDLMLFFFCKFYHLYILVSFLFLLIIFSTSLIIFVVIIIVCYPITSILYVHTIFC